MAYVITQNCCNEASCVAVCPVNCIHPTPDEPDYATAEMLYVDPMVCIDCGACADVCPVDAITADFDLAIEQERFVDVNARYFLDPVHLGYPTSRPKSTAPVKVASPETTLRVAIVGSGPSASYAAEELCNRKDVDVSVDMFERLPTPFGLVRFGVAPDHQETKAVIKGFSRTAGRKNVNLYLNVEIGRHISHEELLEHYHCIIYAVGASHDRRLGVTGEDLPGSHPATDFVAWYNGHPGFSDLDFDLSCERAVVVGNGNVALDVARILLTDVDHLRKTDIADHALAALADSNISEVVVLGRRGAMQAAFTTPELLGLIDNASFDTLVDPIDVELDTVTSGIIDSAPHAMPVLKREILTDLVNRNRRAQKALQLRFLSSPSAILGSDRVTGLRIERNRLVRTDDGRILSEPTADFTELECGLVLRSVGYRGAALPGLPFDSARGVLPNVEGRVTDTDSGVPTRGVYTTGWIKRGPSGVIGTNKKCARETVESLVSDYLAGHLDAPRHEAEAFTLLIENRQPDLLDFASWEILDRHERKQGRRERRPRVKLTSVPEMLAVLDSAKTPAQ